VIPEIYVCAWCNRVRATCGDWTQASAGEASCAETTHGICPECLARETRAALSPAPPSRLADEGR